MRNLALQSRSSLRVTFILPALTEATSPYWRPIKYSLFPPLGLATLAVAFLFQMAGVLFWAGSAAERISALERTTIAREAAFERVAVLEDQITTMRDQLTRIETKLDRLQEQRTPH